MPCRALYPHERSLVSNLQGKPFALLGVNGDSDREAVRRVITVKGLNWRSWWDGDGRIARRWKVEQLPTVYVLDARGVVRYRFTAGVGLERALEQAVQTLLGEVEGQRVAMGDR
jgi:hypothetical protein